ncbi:MAG: nodulation protein NfeD [Chloroflexota bacterium]
MIIRRLGFVLVLLIVGFIPYLVSADENNQVIVLTVEGAVSPVMLGYIERGIEAAEEADAEAVVLQLDTPGGQIDLTREIVQVIINADVPVIVYVAPSGAFAASAGTFITLAGHAAAMAPQTTIGAASPVSAGGADIDETMKAKVENVLVADIENLAERRGEDALKWAKKAITEAEAIGAKEALEIGIIDVIATDVDDLLTQLDQTEVTIQDEARTLATADAATESLEMTIIERILAVFLQPEIAFILLSIGSLAIIYELASPGGFIGGVVGLICLILAFYALGQLPINYAGLGLIVLAFILFTVELFTPTHGVLTMSGVITLALGGILLFDTAEFDYQVSYIPIIGFSVGLGAIFFFIIGKALATLRNLPKTGGESMVGALGVAKTAVAPNGIVFVDGARWQANQASNADMSIEAGDDIEVVAIQGFKLTVKKKS